MPKKPHVDLEFPDDTEKPELDFDNPAQELVGKLPTIAQVFSEPLFEIKLWKNTTEVYKCAKCDSFRNKDEKDEFILHILTHYSDEDEKEAVLDRLLKELN